MPQADPVRPGMLDDTPNEDALVRFERANSEFEDLPPGAYIREWRAGWLEIAWGVATIVVAIAAIAAWRVLDAESPWWLLATFGWRLALPSSIVLAIVTVGQLRADSPPARRTARWALGLAGVGLALWLVATFFHGVVF